MKSLSSGIGDHMQSEREVIKDMDKNFDSTNDAVTGVMGRVDDLLSQASSSLTCYVCIFLLIFIVLLCKLT